MSTLLFDKLRKGPTLIYIVLQFKLTVLGVLSTLFWVIEKVYCVVQKNYVFFFENNCRPRISAAFWSQGKNKRHGAYSSKYGTCHVSRAAERGTGGKLPRGHKFQGAS